MNVEVVVRNYCPEDSRDVWEIMSEYPSPTGREWSRKLVSEMISDALGEQPDGIFVAEMSGKVIGFAIVTYKEWFKIAYIDYIQVRLDWIGKGVGHKLIERCMEWARRKGARIVYTETGRNNNRAVKFYRKHGFRVTGYIPSYYRDGLDSAILVNLRP